jgi:hypothetical protein
LYEPEILTEIKHDGTRFSRVVIRVYIDRDNKEIFSQLSMDDFSIVTYQNVKDMYEALFDDDEMNDANMDKVDDSVFGFDGGANNTCLGHFYIFLATIYNMIDLKLDRTPVIDSKGQV